MTRRLAWLVLLVTASSARADLFSPGELAKAHRELDGLSNCTQCHPEGGKLSQETCLACHTELKGRVAKGVGFHGRIPGEKRECENCHKDHQGRDVSLITWGAPGKKGFEHQRTGWPLKGKHERLECDKCHQNKLVKVPVIAQLLEKSPERRTYLGLRTRCTECHADEHRGQLEGDCDYCHREADWKPAAGFKHDETAYPLKGRHLKVKCEKCHPAITAAKVDVVPALRSETYARFSNLDHDACTDCHKDPHDSRFGPRCASCHTVSDWRTIRNSAKERSFHDKTRYQLKGEHLEVACAACHGPWPGQPARFKKMTFAKCNDCHLDAHEGQLEKAAGEKAPDCNTCHSVDGFSPPRFGLKEHQKTRFALEAAHRVVGCAGCHERTSAVLDKVPAPLRAEVARKKRKELFSAARFDFVKPLDRCETCHADVHQGQFEQRAGGCAACHANESFHALRFDHDKDSQFHLSGKHAEVLCVKCHAPDRRGEPMTWRPIDPACDTCHTDAHVGQFPSRGCDDCHGTTDFKKVNFVHRPPNTDFVLEGKHTAVQCAKCHPAVNVGKGVKAQRFKGLPQSCEGCHADFHQGAFQGFEP